MSAMPMVSSWILLSLLISALVLLAAMAAHDAQRAANRSVRFVWLAAIGAIVALSAAAPLRRAAAPVRLALSANVDVDGSLTSAPASRSPWEQVISATAHALDAVRTAIGAAMQVLDATLADLPNAVHVSIVALWLAASLVTAVVFIATYMRMRRLLQQWPRQRVADTDARIAPAVGPAVMGLAPTEIVLPAWLLERSVDEQRLVVAHEREHVLARDPWVLVAACVAVALMPWNPALWYALNRLRLAVELDCDRRVLQRGIAPDAYGTLLIDLSALRTSAPAFSMPAFSCNTSNLERRLLAMTARRMKFSTTRRLAGGLLALAAIVTACESKLPTSAEVEKMDVASAEAQAKKFAVMPDGKTQYIVDGKAVSEEAAKKVESGAIATVSLRKVQSGSAVNEIEITTNELARRRAIEVNGKPMELKLDESAVVGVRKRSASPDSMRGVAVTNIAASPKRKFDGLLVVNDKIVDASELDRISPDQIVTINVLKGEAAQREYSDPRAAHGVIKVVTKK